MAALPFIDLEEEAQDFDLEEFADARQSTAESINTSSLQHPSAPPAFSFSHVPPTSLHGFGCWPGVQKSQSQSSNANLAQNLFNIWVHVQHYLAPSDCQSLSSIDVHFSLGIICSVLTSICKFFQIKVRCFFFKNNEWKGLHRTL